MENSLPAQRPIRITGDHVQLLESWGNRNKQLERLSHMSFCTGTGCRKIVYWGFSMTLIFRHDDQLLDRTKNL